MSLICLVEYILFQTYKIILNTLIKKHEIIANNLPIQIYVHKIKIRIDFEIKTGYKLELLSPEAINYYDVQKRRLIKIMMEKMYQN